MFCITFFMKYVLCRKSFNAILFMTTERKAAGGMEHNSDSYIPRETLKQFSDLLFTNRELGIEHNPYDQEIREMTAIEQGDLKALQQSLHEKYAGQIGRLAKDELRQAKNLAIVNITLAARAAIRGGIMPEISFSLSDTLIQKTEECTDAQSVRQLMDAMKYQYAVMVHDFKNAREKKHGTGENHHVEKCKNYIFTHLHGKLTLAQIASALSLNAGYLSNLFRRCEGITVTAFIRQEKLNLSRNLLMYSDYSYSEIASYLGFASQSHLGKQFKNAVGMTLREYREAYGVRAFRQEN